MIPDAPQWLQRTPSWVWTARYDGKAHPGAATTIELGEGANCQRYAYAVVGLFGRETPPHRSSELWADPGLGHPGSPAPLDLVLFGASPEPYGAHLGVAVDADAVLHLCAEVGRPAIWSWAEFAARDPYAVRIGLVRVPAAASSRVVDEFDRYTSRVRP